MRFLHLLTFTFQMMSTASATRTCTAAVKTGDGIHLHYNQTGPENGQQLLFVTGWRQAAAEWRKQVDYFSSAGFRVTTYDLRGHGDSEEPEFGYRISRFASDLNNVLTKLNLKDVTIMGHSMGCSVTWAWWDQYPESHHRVSHIVLVDQAAVMVANPHWSPEKAASLSAIFSPNAVFDLADDMANQLEPLAKSMFTPAVSASDLEWILSQNRKMSDAHSASLLIDHAFRDWRDVLLRITVPTLVLAGDVSIFPAAGIEWIATQIPGAESYTFTAAEKGSHFVFWENPERFNSVVEKFITK